MLYTVGSLVSFAAGLNGIRQLMIFFIPLSAALVLLVCFEAREKKVSSVREVRVACGRELGILVCGLLFTLCGIAGYLINNFVFSKIYTFTKYDDIKWSDEPLNSLLDVWFDFLKLYGFQRESYLMSFEGIAAVLGLVAGIAVLISIIRLCMRYRTLGTGIKLILLVTVSTLLINGLIFCLANIDYKQYHWLPLLPFGTAVLIAEIKTEKFMMKYTPKVFLMLVMACITISSFGTVKKELETPLLPVRYGYNQITDWLLKHGYTQGYATFWSSSVLREMSNNAIEVWTIRSGTVVYEWLQEKEHLIREPEKPYFFLFDNRLSGQKEWYTMLNDGSGRLIYQDDFFEIYIYE